MGIMEAMKVITGLVLAMAGAILLMCEPSEQLAGIDWLLVLVLTKLGGVACLWAAYRLTRKIMEVMSHAD